MVETKRRKSQFVRIQVVHEWQSESNPYRPKEIETAIKKLGLPEQGSIPLSEREKNECLIRHETGPEIISLISSLVSLATAVVGLVMACKKHRPETKVQVTVSSAAELKKVLAVLGGRS